MDLNQNSIYYLIVWASTSTDYPAYDLRYLDIDVSSDLLYPGQ